MALEDVSVLKDIKKIKSMIIDYPAIFKKQGLFSVL